MVSNNNKIKFKKMDKEICIICNSPQALEIISNGAFPNLHTKDLFTCNNAFTFFRTEGRHFNFWTDARDIMRHIEMPEKLSDRYETYVQHIYSPFGLKMKSGNYLYPLVCSPIEKGCSSALGALAFLNEVYSYNKIWLIGYTLDETENTEVWNPIDENYTTFIDTSCYPTCYVFEKKRGL